MKKQTTFILSAVAALALSVTSCKKETTMTESESSTDTIVTAEPSMTEPDTVQAPVLNDSNASGTTSGEMEQVP